MSKSFPRISSSSWRRMGNYRKNSWRKKALVMNVIHQQKWCWFSRFTMITPDGSVQESLQDGKFDIHLGKWKDYSILPSLDTQTLEICSRLFDAYLIDFRLGAFVVCTFSKSTNADNKCESHSRSDSINNVFSLSVFNLFSIRQNERKSPCCLN